VQAALADAEKAAETSKQANGQLTVVKKESPQTLLFETREQSAGGAWMHRSYVVK
jgi:predicted SprT family Zn-dependent metalloprotease